MFVMLLTIHTTAQAFDPISSGIALFSLAKEKIGIDTEVDKLMDEAPIADTGVNTPAQSKSFSDKITKMQRMLEVSKDKEQTFVGNGREANIISSDNKKATNNNVFKKEVQFFSRQGKNLKHVTKEHEDEQNNNSERRLMRSMVRNNIASLSNTQLNMWAHVIMDMESSVIRPALKSNPYVLHGLVQPTIEGMMSYNNDTSHGYFGFTLYTFGSVLKYMGADAVDKSDTFYSRRIKDITKIHKQLVKNTRSSKSLPVDQVAAFYGLTVLFVEKIKHDDGALSTRVLTKDDLSYFTKVEESVSKDVEFLSLVLYYKYYNGKLSSQKVKNLFDYYSIHRNVL